MDFVNRCMNQFYLSCIKENNMIKWLLKGLCIFWLTLLPISFSSAVLIWDISWTNWSNSVVWIDLTYWQSWDFVWVNWINANNNNPFEITSLWNWNWNYDNWNIFRNIFQWSFTYNWALKWTFFWNDWQLVFHSKSYNWSSPSWASTRIVSKFAKVSASNIWNFTNYSFDYSLNDVLNSPINLTHQIFGFRRWNDWSLVNTFLNLNSKLIYCLWDWNIFYCASCVPWDTYYSPSCNWWSTWVDLWLTAWSDIWDIVSQWLNASSPLFVNPFVPSNNVPDYEFNEYADFTNWQIIEWYNHMWLTDEFCYWWFAINDIFENWQVPSEFVWYRWGGWASIFDIWNIYSWSFNNDYKTFLGTFYLAYDNDNLSSFYGYPKALYGFVNQWFSVSAKWLSFIEATATQFTLVDIWQYCDIKFHKNLSSLYTWDRWDPKRNYYRSGMVNLWWYFNFSWNNNYFSWSLSGFESPNDFFATLNSIFQWWLKDISGRRDPIIPEYILIFLFAFIFIRILSH